MRNVSFVLYFLLSLALTICSLYLVVYRASNTIGFKISPYILVFLLIILAFGLYLFVKNGNKIEYLFLILVIPIGLFFTFFMLPTTVPDEIWHIYRTMTVFQDLGSHMEVSRDATYNIPALSFSYGDFYDCLNSATNWDDTLVIERDMSKYLFLQYLVSGTFFQIAKLVGCNYWICSYIASLSNLILFCISGYIFVRYIPFGKRVSLVFLLNPMLIQQEASCSADAICNICAILFVLSVIINYLSDTPRKINLLLMLCLAFLMSICKVGAYSPLCLLMLVFIFKVKDRKKRISLICLTFIVGSLLYIYFVYFYEGSLFSEARELMRNPFRLLTVLLNTFRQWFGLQFSWYFGCSLGSLDISVPRRYWMLYLILQTLILIIPEKYDGKHLKCKEKVTFTIVCLIELFAIYMTQVGWARSVDGNFDVITGVQGRYFIPFIIVLLLCFCRLKKVDGNNFSSLFNSFNVSCNSDSKPIKPKDTFLVFIKENYVNLIIIFAYCYVDLGVALAVLNHFGI